MVESLISIIIPIYNVENYISECIESVINQTYRNLEIILVDDGSLDRSPLICDEFAIKDSRIVVKHITNSGNTNARKQGLEIANGDFIGFVDADDWIDPKMYEELYSHLCFTEADMVVSAFFLENTGLSIQNKNAISPGVYKDELLKTVIFSNMIDDKKSGEYGILPNLWNKLFKKQLIYENLMQIDNRIFYGEDAAIVYCACLEAKKICVVNEAWYHYRVRNDSICTTSNRKIFENNMLLYDYLNNKIKKMHMEVQMIPQLKRYIIKLNAHGMKFIYDIGAQYSKFWMFPFDKVPKGSKIILYGAGTIGTMFYKQLEAVKMYELKAWVDTNYKKLYDEGMPVISPDFIVQYEYDYIIIALNNVKNFEKIFITLVSLGVKQEKIIWSEFTTLSDVRVLKSY